MTTTAFDQTAGKVHNADLRIRIPGKKAKAGTVLGLVMALTVVSLGTSCAGKVDMELGSGGDAKIAIKSEFPAALAARIRDFGKIPADTYLFDTVAARASLQARPGVKVESIEAPNRDTITAVVRASDLARLATEGDIAEAKLVKLTKDKAWTELRVSLSRENAGKVYALIPGVDKRLVESLSPPALEEDPVTSAEYRMNLETAVIGKKAMPSFDMAGIDLSIKAPGPIIASGGGTVSGSTFRARLKLFDILTLEKPVELWIRWK